MNKKDLKNSSFVININSSIQDAMEKITDNHRGTVVVVDDEFYVEGIIADGDIRRAMVKGAVALAPISKIMNTDPVFVTEAEYKEGKADDILKGKADISIIPVVGDDNKLIDIAVRDPERRKEI